MGSPSVLLDTVNVIYSYLVKGFSFGFLIFLALMLHKAPEAFSVGAFLIHERCSKKSVYLIITVSTPLPQLIALITPVVAIVAYFCISLATGGSDESRENYSLVAICLLISAGSFLYVATIHVMPEVYCNNDVHRPHSHSHFAEKEAHESNEHGKMSETLIVIAGAVTPFLLTMFLGDDD
eukprot:TRINITY_DN3905_c0_g5_i1.p2 TRINITY_DN3905_c0_g5~~TRINITY_DN3905_c0_g5_i1.p2  ORF type:complete len:180 (-),score=38.34 TRINITY_DN3905_c0_g5_i1:150-689(-)